MECAGIKDILSEYIDGALDAHTKALIDEHLLTCPDCKEEVVSLKALVKGLGSLESVKAPDDFLEKLHERMKPRITLRKIMLVLFIPWRIKIPLEFASAMAMAVIIFSIFYNQPPTKIIHMLPEGESHIGVSEQSATDMVRPSAKGKALDSEPALKKAIPLRQAKKNEVIDLALVVKKKRADYADVPHKDMEMASAQPAAKQRPGPVGQATPNVEMKTFSRKGQAAGSFKKEKSALKEEYLSPSSSLEHTFNKVNELIRLAEGKTLSVKYDPNTGLPQSICVEIFPENYKSFSEKLRGLATLQPPLPTISEKGREAVKIQIRFILE